MKKLLELILSRDNLNNAYKRVKANKGAAGVDGINVDQLWNQIKEEWPRIEQEILQGTYKPQPVRRVEIPKPGGGVRLLGIPTAMDRLIQQAILQVLGPIFDIGFSNSSYGFRPGRSAKDAVNDAKEHINAGYNYVVDMDLEKFFDRANHDMLMSRVARKIEDKRVLKLIRAFLNSGIMRNGIKVRSEVGTPQGGPLSPLLANILLDDLDKELEKRGHKFCRYADDCNIYVKSERAGQRVMASIRKYLEGKLKLKVNEAKSAVSRPWKRKFLGFSFTYGKLGNRIRISPQALERFKERIRRLTNPTWSTAMEDRIDRLNDFLIGWVAYYSLADTPSPFKRLEGWIRRRLRSCLWHQWKRVRTRIRELRNRGLSEEEVFTIANTRKGEWRTAKTPQIHKALNNAFWRKQGLVSLTERYFKFC